MEVLTTLTNAKSRNQPLRLFDVDSDVTVAGTGELLAWLPI